MIMLDYKCSFAEQVVCGRCSQALVSLEPHTCPPGFTNTNTNSSSDTHNNSQPASSAADAGPLVGRERLFNSCLINLRFQGIKPSLTF